MFCANCGAAVESDSKFCDSCGKALHLAVTGEQLATAPGPTEHLGRRWGKPLLIIALSAVAATAAVIVYEKVGGSVTQHSGSSAAQEFTGAIASALNPDTLTRSEAQALLDRNHAHAWRQNAVCAAGPCRRRS